MSDKSNIDPCEFTELLDSYNESQIAMIKSVLDSAGIQYIIQGDNLSYQRHIVPARFLVKKDDIEKVRILLKDFI